MSEDSLEGYGGVLAAPARSGWRTVLDVIGILDLIAAAVLAAVVVVIPHGSVLGCQTLTPPAGSQHVRAVAFSPDGRTLATVGTGGRTYLWDVATGRRTATLSGPSAGGPAGSAAFSWDGTILAVPGRSDGARGGGGLDSVATGPDGWMMAFGNANGRVDVYGDGGLIVTLTTPDGAAVTGVAAS